MGAPPAIDDFGIGNPHLNRPARAAHICVLPHRRHAPSRPGLRNALEKIMTRNGERRTKEQQQESRYGVARRKAGAVAAMAGRAVYRDEYRRNYGPDLDESLDGTELRHEFSAPAIQTTRY